MKTILSLVVLFSWGWVVASPDGSLPSRGEGAVAPPAESSLLEGLSALHQGRFSEGRERFRVFLEGDPADPRGHLFLAFSEWWRSLQLRGVAESPDMEFHLQETIRLAQERLETKPGDPETLAHLGTGYIFLAQYRASQGKVFRAALAAKKGKSYLEKSLESRPDLVDSRFGLGAYNYYADKVNLLVKGLRTVLFLPGGNSELGLSQLQEVADKGRYFRTEAHLLLAIIFQGHHERRYLKSIEHLRAALALNPDSPLILMSLGEIQIRLGRYPEAQVTLRHAVKQGLRSDDPDQAALARLARLLLADSLDLSLHSDEALRELLACLGGGTIHPDLRNRALAVATRAATRSEEPGSLQKVYDDFGVDAAQRESLLKRYGTTSGEVQVVRALREPLRLMEAEEWDEAARQLQDIHRRFPASPEVELHRARLHFEQGRWKEAEEGFRRIPEGSVRTIPAWIRGWRNLYLGRSLFALGRKGDAKAFYTRAADLEGFRGKDLARALLGPEGEMSGLWPERIFSSGIQVGKNSQNVLPGLPEGGDSPVPIHGLLAGVVGR